MIAFPMKALHGVRFSRLFLLGAFVAQTISQSAFAQTSQPSIQDQILSNLRNAFVGRHTLGDLNLPEDYLRRVGDRILRNSYEQQFRVVVPDGSNANIAPSAAQPPPIDGLEEIAVPSGSIWQTLVAIAIAVCSLAMIILIVQALRANR